MRWSWQSTAWLVRVRAERHATHWQGGKHTLHARAAERRDPAAILERHCPTRLDLKAFNRRLGQRSDDLVNIAAISAGRFQSQIRRVRQDNPKGPPVWLPVTNRR
jgi:hypothetical protein